MTIRFRFFPLWPIEHDEDGTPRCGCKRATCRDIGKHPRVRWRQWDGCEIDAGGGCGIPTGDGFFVIDLDVRPATFDVEGRQIKPAKNGVATLLTLSEGKEPLPDTFTVYTPSGGVHLYFLEPPGVPISNAREVAPGIDVRGRGGYVAGPGSPHRKGGTYRAENEETPIAPAPAWLVELVKPRALESSVESSHRTVDPASPEGAQAIVWAVEYLTTKAKPAIEGAGGSDTFYHVCCELMRSALPLDVLQELVEEHYNPRCEPPWSPGEIEHKLEDTDAGADVVRGLPSPGFFERLLNRVSDPQPQEPDPAHQYTFEAGMRAMGESKKASFGDLQADLWEHRDWAGVLSYDSFRARVRATNPPMRMDAETESGLSDTDIDLVRSWFEYNGKRFSKDDVRSALEIVARRRSFNPVQDWLRSLHWDGVPRLDRVLPDYFMSADMEYERSIGPRWFISLVARAMMPGCQSDCTLILEGPQGIGKTSAFRALMHDPTWYAESSSGVDSKDFYENLRGVWLMGFDELDSLTRRSLTKVKTVLTSVRDKYRKSYGRYSDSHPRSAGFCGSTNEKQYFNDDTGSRRFWPVVVLSSIDVSKIVCDRDQIWAEAFVRWQAGEAWHVNTPELQKLCEIEQEKRLEIDSWEEAVREWLGDPTKVSLISLDGIQKDTLFKGGLRPYDASKGVTTAAVLERAIGKLKGQWSIGDTMRVSRVLRRFGMSRVRVRINGVLEWRFIMPSTSENAENGSGDEKLAAQPAPIDAEMRNRFEN